MSELKKEVCKKCFLEFKCRKLNGIPVIGFDNPVELLPAFEVMWKSGLCMCHYYDLQCLVIKRNMNAQYPKQEELPLENCPYLLEHTVSG